MVPNVLKHSRSNKGQLIFVVVGLLLLAFIVPQYPQIFCAHQVSFDGKAGTVSKFDVMNNVDFSVQERNAIGSDVNESLRRTKEESNLCYKYRDVYAQCDPTILHDISSVNLIQTNLGKFLQSLNVSKSKLKSSKRVSCPRQPLEKFDSDLITGLISFPGSGNTWTRHILQQLTGIMTGAVYNAKRLRINGFPGEGLTHHVIVVKCHKANETEMGGVFFDKRVFLLRNPYDAFLAEFKRGPLHLGKIGTTDKVKADGEVDGLWKKYMERARSTWSSLVTNVLQDSTRETLVIFYEDLLSCLLPELIRLANFLKTDTLTRFSLCCALKETEGLYHRNHIGDKMIAATMYSRSQRLEMDETLKKLALSLESTHPLVAKRVDGYRSSDN